MVSYDPTVAGNIRKHERDIRKLGTAPLGPVSLGPGDHIRPEDSDAFRFDQSGAYSSHRGVLWNLSDLTGSFANSIEAHTNLLSEHDGRLDGHDSRLGAAEGRLDGHDSTLSSHNTRITNAQSRADAAHSNAATAQSRADSAWTRAGTALANAATAQSRADSAWTRAGTAQSAADSAASAAATAAARATKIINCINGVTLAGTSLSGEGFSTMATASEWQQLKNCINS